MYNFLQATVSSLRRIIIRCNLKWFCLSIILYADNPLLLASTVSSLQQLLFICESELEWLDLSINASKSSCIRVGPRYNTVCCNLTSLDGREIIWVEKVRYLGIYLVSSKVMNGNYYYDLSKSSSIAHVT